MVHFPSHLPSLTLLCVCLEDELIREVTINCAERGLLLLRVRDEIRMTIAAYQTLYESSVAFGMRKALQAEQGKSDMERKVSGVYHEPLALSDSSLSGPHGCPSIPKSWLPEMLSHLLWGPFGSVAWPAWSGQLSAL